MDDVAAGAWKMSLLQEHVKGDCCCSCDCCHYWIKECEVEESELLLMNHGKEKYESGTVVLSYS
jgi:hypothetical protein